VDLLTITSPENNVKGERQKVVFITARVHPGESPASFVCQGNTSIHQKLLSRALIMASPWFSVLNRNWRRILKRSEKEKDDNALSLYLVFHILVSVAVLRRLRAFSFLVSVACTLIVENILAKHHNATFTDPIIYNLEIFVANLNYG